METNYDIENSNTRKNSLYFMYQSNNTSDNNSCNQRNNNSCSPLQNVSIFKSSVGGQTCNAIVTSACKTENKQFMYLLYIPCSNTCVKKAMLGRK